jgi:hypothetical protein
MKGKVSCPASVSPRPFSLRDAAAALQRARHDKDQKVRDAATHSLAKINKP